jgi:hypothetical protein
MKRALVILGTCAVLSAAPLNAFAHGDDAGAAILGGVVGGLIGSAILGYPGYPVYVAPRVVVPYTPPPVVVEPYYAPAPVVVERYGPPVVYYGGGGRYWHGHGYHRHWHGHD